MRRSWGNQDWELTHPFFQFNLSSHVRKLQAAFQRRLAVRLSADRAGDLRTALNFSSGHYHACHVHVHEQDYGIEETEPYDWR